MMKMRSRKPKKLLPLTDAGRESSALTLSSSNDMQKYQADELRLSMAFGGRVLGQFARSEQLALRDVDHAMRGWPLGRNSPGRLE